MSSKRIFDIILSSFFLVILSPSLLLLAVLVKISSKGPVIYKSKRIGFNQRDNQRRHDLFRLNTERRNGERRMVDLKGEPFCLLKFRTMVHKADKMGPDITYNDDPRITKLGRFLRRTKMDELPSLINVIRGDMSLVGPRPESPYWVSKYTDQDEEVLRVKPGITGYSQIKYRNEENILNGDHLATEYETIMKDKLNTDINYIKTKSLREDIKILFQTAKVLIN